MSFVSVEGERDNVLCRKCTHTIHTLSSSSSVPSTGPLAATGSFGHPPTVSKPCTLNTSPWQGVGGCIYTRVQL